MRIVNRPGDPGGAEMQLAAVMVEEKGFVYFLPPGTNKAQLSAPHFVAAPGVIFGDLAPLAYDMNGKFSEFVNPAFSGHEELKRLRAENAELRRSQPAAQELEELRAGRAELELFRAEERERAQLKGRLAALDTPHDKRSETV